MRPSVPDVHITDPQDAELAAYRTLAGQAVVGLICGLLAPFAMVDPMLWAIPILGMLFSWWALRRIKANAPAMTGRKMALAGLALSLLFLAAAPADRAVYRHMVRNEARHFSALWFEYLLQDEPHKAYQLTVQPTSRQPLDDRLWAYYRSQPKLRQNLYEYVELPLVQSLLALGPKAQVRFYRTADQEHNANNDRVGQLYAVTYEDGGERNSFFVRVEMLRKKLRDGTAGWRILSAGGGVRPEG